MITRPTTFTARSIAFISTLKACLFFLGIAFASRVAEAQPVFTVHRSIELRVAQAQFVVRGTISHLTRTVLEPPDSEVLYTKATKTKASKDSTLAAHFLV